jgi:hypothetical protein
MCADTAAVQHKYKTLEAIQLEGNFIPGPRAQLLFKLGISDSALLQIGFHSPINSYWIG